MVLGVDEGAVRDGINVLSSNDLDACLANVVCRMGPNFYVHLSQVWGFTRVMPVESGTAVVALVFQRERPMRLNRSIATISS